MYVRRRAICRILFYLNGEMSSASSSWTRDGLGPNSITYLGRKERLIQGLSLAAESLQFVVSDGAICDRKAVPLCCPESWEILSIPGKTYTYIAAGVKGKLYSNARAIKAILNSIFFLFSHALSFPLSLRVNFMGHFPQFGNTKGSNVC